MAASVNLNLGLKRRVPLVLQTEAAECGLASLAMVAGYYGDQSDLTTLRRRFGASTRGATLKDLIRIADELGFAARPVRLELDELGKLRTPCVLHWDLNHFVTLTRVAQGKVHINDPAGGARVLSLEETSPHFTGIALELSPTAKFKPAAAGPKLRARDVLGRIDGVGAALAKIAAMALALEIFAMMSPLFLSWVVDQAIVSADRDLLITLAIGFFLLMLLTTAVSTMRSWALMGMNASLKVQARANLFTHLVNLPTGYFEARYLGDVMSRFGSQETILQAITSDLVEAVFDGLMATITMIVMLLFAPDLGALAILFTAVYAALRWASYTPLRQASNEAIIWGARRDSHFMETLRGVRAIKLFNGQHERRSRWVNLLVEAINRQLTAQKLRILFTASSRLLLGSLQILTVLIGARKILDGTFSVGLLLAFVAYKDQFVGRCTELINRAVDLTMLRLQAERLADIALEEPEAAGAGGARLRRGRGLAIEARKLSFRYRDDEPWILDNVSFRVNPGESLAIVGPSGGGKTTLLKILCGLLEPTRGELLIDGQPLKNVGLQAYREAIGVVMQDDQLFAGSILDNVCFFADTPDRERVQICCQLAAVHDDIAKMPMAYETLIGDMGAALSGGQKQRLLLARALYRNPSLLLLDEATSHLDVERERSVNESLRRMLVTRIVIAHRPETIRASDRTLHLSEGRLVDGGYAPDRPRGRFERA